MPQSQPLIQSHSAVVYGQSRFIHATPACAKSQRNYHSADAGPRVARCVGGTRLLRRSGQRCLTGSSAIRHQRRA
ncbi:hypothetical protein SKAU_G00257330 [Synaphobranchus kaupii]|uniref:Uncharacterized protein n=1 Tax=Synaphobranchus kaupii TaxID=118154 RepID=A0A9Q1IS74_SYNKA|nr:hypothetical protein SKAU_G00257330 [Synaphobranchus kaupii]